MPEVQRIAVIGSGTMGSQIAAQSALHGVDVTLVDSDLGLLDQALASTRNHLHRRVEKGVLTEAQLEEIMARMIPTTDLKSVASADMVIEAVYEDLAVKQEVFIQLAEFCRPDTILASNSSTYPISKIAGDLPYSERTCNIHFFHPVLVMKLVEVMRGPETSNETVAAVLAFADRIEREAVLIEREITGLIVNRVLAAIKREALWLADQGYAEPEDIDRAVKLGLNHPMGPFELTDFSGVDVFYRIMRERFSESGDEAWRPPKLLEDKVKAGELGRKTGRGFYSYD